MEDYTTTMENHTINMENHTANMENQTVNIDLESCHVYMFVMVTIIGGCICLIGLVCNMISLYALCGGVVQAATSYQLVWLAVVDSILLVVWSVHFAPGHAMKYFNVDSDHLYQRVIFPITFVSILLVYYTAQTCTIWLTVFIAVYRFLAVCKPYSKYYSHVERHGQKYVMLVLSMAVLFNIPHCCEWYLVQGERNGQVNFDMNLTSLGKSDKYELVYYTIIYSTFVVALPLIVIIIVTVRILMALKKRQSKKRNMQTTTTSSQGNINAVLITVIIIFLICQTPYLATMIRVVYGSCSLCDSCYMFFWTSYVFIALNSAANPFIYFIVNKQFRSLLKTHCQCTRNDGIETIEMGTMDTHAQ